MVIMADATQIDQILFNLVANARDAMPRGGSSLSYIEDRHRRRFVHTHGYGKPGAYVMVIVSDTGTGMDEATKERSSILSSARRKWARAPARSVHRVRHCEAAPRVYQRLQRAGTGTTFRIYLPLVGSEAPREKEPELVAQRGTETILVAEDNADLRRLVTKVLTRHGYRAIEAVDGEDAINKHRKHKGIDLVIVDSVMPKKNGREVYEEIRKADPGLRSSLPAVIQGTPF
jgi:hypothetical protein